MKTINITSKICVVLILLFSFASIFSIAQKINYTNSWGKNGFTIIHQSSKSLEINHSISSIQFSKVQVNNKTQDIVKIPGIYLPHKEENPNIHVNSCFIAIPNGASISFEITETKTETYSNIEQATASQISKQIETEVLDYTKNKFYPEGPVKISNVLNIRGIDAVVLSISPLKYNPVTKKLIVYRDLKVIINFEGGIGYFGEDRLQNRWWDPLFQKLYINHNSLPEINYSQQLKNFTDDDGAEYLIISPNGTEFQQWADSIKNFRTTQGILTKVVTLDEIGGNDVTMIENYINEAYNTWDIPPAAILLLGDDGTDPANSIKAPVWDSYCISDNVYADVNENDLPDIVIARMCAQNEGHLETIVSKVLNYEFDPPTNPDFYNHPITSCNFHISGYFQLLTESVAGFYENVLGKSTNRINVGPDPLPDEWGTGSHVNSILQLFGPAGLGYIPATPGEVSCSWNSTTQDVIDGINNGAFMLLHRSQASEQGWAQPPFTINDINNLTNTDLTFVWSPDDLIGKFDATTACFAEKFHRHTYGALGIIAASEINYGFVKEIYTWAAWDFMWPDFLPEQDQIYPNEGVYPAFANAAGKYALEQTPWPVPSQNKKVAYHTLHFFGDAFSSIYSEIPQELEVLHANFLQSGESIFEVIANEGSFVALSVNGELIGVAEGIGEPVEIQIPPQTFPDQILVTATKQNYFRYESIVPVITNTGFNDLNRMNDILVFPNPTSGKLSIKTLENKEEISIIVFNTLSEVVFNTTFKCYKENIFNINLTDLMPGLYFILQESSSSKTVHKIVIQ